MFAKKGQSSIFTERMLKLLTILLSVSALASCAGYRIIKTDNPLKSEQIHSITIPMFINKSSLPQLSGIFTRAFFDVFHQFPKLKVYSGENSTADAVLLGIIKSPKKHQEVFARKSVISAGATNSLGGRPPFFVPASTSYVVEVQLVLIKNPSFQDWELINTRLGDKLPRNSKIVFNHSFKREAVFNRSVREVTDEDSAGIINSTMTAHFFQKSLQQTAKNVAIDFKEFVLNVF